MIINPELRRHLWLDFSAQKLILTPIVIGIILYITHIIHGSSVQGTAYLIFLFFCYIWGTKAAAESIPDELNQRTWDYQRLSSIKPWNLAWGKLIGSTAYPWYGAIIALIPYTVTTLETVPISFFIYKLSILLLGGFLAHASALVFSMNALQWEKTKTGTFWYLVFGLFFAYGLMEPALQTFVNQDHSAYSFYGINLTRSSFAFYSLCVFLFWMLVGLYRRMRTALQYPSFPWVWFAFSVFYMAYVTEFFNFDTSALSKLSTQSFGTTYDKIHLPHYVALCTGAILTYIALFSEKITIRRYQKIKDKFLKASIPFWIASSLATLGMAIIIACVSPWSIAVAESTELSSTFIPTVFLLSFMLFFIRDIALIHYFKFSDTPQKSTLTSICYLLMLYALIPGLLLTLHVPSVLMTFVFPSSANTWIMSLIAPAIEAGFMIWLVKKRISG